MYEARRVWKYSRRSAPAGNRWTDIYQYIVDELRDAGWEE
jgi:hypothetical protein